MASIAEQVSQRTCCTRLGPGRPRAVRERLASRRRSNWARKRHLQGHAYQGGGCVGLGGADRSGS